jgi:hypothetical protein
MRNIAIKVVDRLFIVVYGAGDPTDDEWQEYLTLVRRHGVDRTMQLVFTEGGEPTSAQRRLLNELLAGRPVPVAVVSASARVRGTVTALSWFNRTIRAFPPQGLRDALDYLEIPVSRMDLIQREVACLRAELAQGRRASA